MATINFELEVKKSQNEHSIFLRFRHQVKEYKDSPHQWKYYPGFKVKLSKWDKNKQRLKGRDKNSILMNDRLDEIEAKLKEIVKEQRKKANEAGFRQPRIEDIHKEFEKLFPSARTENKSLDDQAKPVEVKYYLYDLLKFYIDEKKSEYSENTLKTYRRIVKNTKEFASTTKNSVEIKDINKVFYSDYKKYLIEDKEYTNSTINTEIKRIKTVLNYYQDDFDISSDFRSFRKIGKDDDGQRFTCTNDEVIAFYNFQFSDRYEYWVEGENQKIIINRETFEKVRDIYVFSFNTGLAYRELKNLHESNLQNIEVDGKNFSVINFNRQKTQKQIIVPLNKTALEVIEKYKGKYKKLLPVFTNQRVNFYLHLALKFSGIFDDKVQVIKYSGKDRIEKVIPRYQALTMHTARHGFATSLVNAKFPLPYIQKLLGHSSIKTTEIYAKANPMEVIKETMKIMEEL